jgi:hypothetical protein
MKIGSIFWGTLFIVVGGLFLVDNLGILDVHWWTVFKFWPLVLIFWGLAAIFGKQPMRWYAILLIVVLVLVMFVVAGAFEWIESGGEFDRSEGRTQTFTEPYDGISEKAELRFQSGAGKFTIQGTSDQLIDVSTQTTFGRYILDHEHWSGGDRIELRFSGKSPAWFLSGMRNRAEIRLHPNPTWDLDIDIGAASLDADLTPFKIDEVTIDGGAASYKIKLGDRSDEARLHIRTGASSVDIEVPQTVGCELNIIAPLSGKTFHGFEKVGKRVYQTEGFEEATKKIYIDIEAGVSSFRVERY